MVVPYHKTGNTERGSVVAGSAFLTLSFAVSQKYPKRHVVTGIISLTVFKMIPLSLIFGILIIMCVGVDLFVCLSLMSPEHSFT